MLTSHLVNLNPYLKGYIIRMSARLTSLLHQQNGHRCRWWTVLTTSSHRQDAVLSRLNICGDIDSGVDSQGSLYCQWRSVAAKYSWCLGQAKKCGWIRYILLYIFSMSQSPRKNQLLYGERSSIPSFLEKLSNQQQPGSTIINWSKAVPFFPVFWRLYRRRNTSCTGRSWKQFYK